MRTRRRLTLGLLAAIAVTLLAVFAGMKVGDRIRVASQAQGADAPVLPTPVPADAATYAPARNGWKRAQVTVIATDPAFPDPRVTPTPEPPPTPRPTPAPTPRPTPTASPDADASPGASPQVDAP